MASYLFEAVSVIIVLTKQTNRIERKETTIMNTEFIKEKRDYIDYIRSIEKNFREMTDGFVSETEAVEFITAALPEAKPCKRNTALWFWMFEEPSELPSDIRVACVY